MGQECVDDAGKYLRSVKRTWRSLTGPTRRGAIAGRVANAKCTTVTAPTIPWNRRARLDVGRPSGPAEATRSG